MNENAKSAIIKIIIAILAALGGLIGGATMC